MGSAAIAQSIRGSIVNENDQPVPYATIFIRELNSGTTTNEQGRYFMVLNAGIYHIAISCIGYESQSLIVTITDGELIKNIKLQTSSTQLNELVVRASKRDPAFEIIQSVIENKEKHLTQVKSYKTNIYVRAVEQVDKKKKAVQQNSNDEIQKLDPTKDPIEEARKMEEARLMQINLIEMQLTLNYQYPENYKEERTAYKLYGNKEGLYIPVFSQADFNFYHNLVDMKGIAEIPLISPISRTAILSYKYKLEAVLKENEKVVYKIRVIPRKSGDATVNGFLFINDSTWNINRLEFTIEKGGLRFYDLFTIKQKYEEVSKDWWIPTRQEFTYETKASGRIFKGKTILAYSDYEKDAVFPPRFFGNEVSVITRDAFKKDSSYWNQQRPEALSTDEKKLIAIRDSIEAVRSSKRYLDSINAKFNKVTIGEVLYHGVGFRNGEKKSSINFASLL
ncbi:MAG: carboxypeptidase-like regulatory domain-containing protein, partial [Cytophagia bacterium]|nr:carboxypeptidase-like regulatory domain-containing protein [Cytophagia bacterium]